LCSAPYPPIVPIRRHEDGCVVDNPADAGPFARFAVAEARCGEVYSSPAVSPAGCRSRED
jgi:hypothetical protein